MYAVCANTVVPGFAGCYFSVKRNSIVKCCENSAQSEKCEENPKRVRIMMEGLGVNLTEC